MNNKNYNNDHESFMEGIYGCMERIEAGIIELQKVQPNKGNSAANDEDRTALVHGKYSIKCTNGDEKYIKCS